MSSVVVPEVRVGTRMFLIAPGVQELASWDGADGETKARQANKKGYFAETFSQKEERNEYDTRIKNDVVHLYRQMDTQDFVFAYREALSTRGVAPPARKCLSANAYQNTSRSRIHRISCQARYEVEGHCCRVFLDPNGKNNHRSTQRHVPLGKTTPQGGEC
jgi:hypothetical protein